MRTGSRGPLGSARTCACASEPHAAEAGCPEVRLRGRLPQGRPLQLPFPLLALTSDQRLPQSRSGSPRALTAPRRPGKALAAGERGPAWPICALAAMRLFFTKVIYTIHSFTHSPETPWDLRHSLPKALPLSVPSPASSCGAFPGLPQESPEAGPQHGLGRVGHRAPDWSGGVPTGGPHATEGWQGQRPDVRSRTRHPRAHSALPTSEPLHICSLYLLPSFSFD